MNRSIRFVVVVVVLLVIAGGVFVVLLRELDRDGSRVDTVPVFMNPVRDLRVGDWAEYRREGGRVERWEAVAVGPYGYSVKTTGILPDGTIQDYGDPRPHTKWDMGFGERFRFISLQPEKVTVAGREWNSWRVECDSKLVGPFVSWISDEVPFGLLRRQRVLPGAGLVPEGGLQPAAPTSVEYNYEYLRHGYIDPEGQTR